MSGLLTLAGVFTVSAGLFGKAHFGDKAVAVVLTGLVMIGAGRGLSSSPADCPVSWDARGGQYLDC